VSSQDCLIFLVIVHPTVESETIPVTVIPELMPVFGVIFPESWEKMRLPQLPKKCANDSRKQFLSKNALDFQHGGKMVCLFLYDVHVI